MLAFEYREASAEKKKELLQEIISLYNMADKAQVIQCLAHAQAVYEVTQDEFVEVAGVSSARTMREWKREYIEIYDEAFEKYTPTPEVLDVNVKMDEDVLEQVYQNMLAKLSDKKTNAKDLSTLLTYLNISSAELKQYAKHRGSTLRTFVKDNEALLIKDADTLSITKAVLAESDYLYFGSEKTVGNTDNFLQMDMDNPLVRLELQTAGMLMYSLWNGTIHPNYVEMAETLRVLKMASGQELDTKKAVTEFDSIDGKPKPKKPITEKMRKDMIDIFGQADGEEMYQQLLNAKSEVDKKTAIVLPTYETVQADYEKHLKVFPSLENMPLNVFLSKLDGDADKSYKETYKNYLNNQEEK